jgi:hypothetical protein
MVHSGDVLEPSPAGMDPKAVRVTSQLALAVYAESLAERGHVTVIGDSSIGLGSLLVRLGARAVEVWDPDIERARGAAEHAARGVTVRPLSRDQPEVRDVDLVVVPDLGCFPDPADLLARVRRMVGGEGAAIVAAANRDGTANEGSPAFDYYELFDLVAREFDCARMIAQLPFYGVTLAELGDEDHSPAVSVDTQLAEMDRPPEVFIVLASQRDVRLDAYSIIELPPPPAPLRALVDNSDAGRRLQDLEALNGDLRARAAEGDRLAEAVAVLEKGLHERSEAVVELEAVLADRTRQVTQLSLELQQMRATAQAERSSAEAIEEIARRADRAEKRTVLLEMELQHTDARVDEHVRLEEALRERAAAVRLLEGELARRDQMIRELAGALEDTVAGGSSPAEENVDARDEENARLRGRLDALALELARREGEAQATVWKVAELERGLALGTTGTQQGGPGFGGQLSAALDEVDALRRALLQEHEARVRAESAGGPAAQSDDNSR